MDSRIALPPDTSLCFKNKEGGLARYTVVKEIGRGGTCIVYDAFYETNTGDINYVRIKECYPCRLRIERTAFGELKADSKDASQFYKAQEKLRSDFTIGNGLYYSEGLFDALINNIDIYSANGTTYIVSVYSPESTLASFKPKDIKTCVCLVKQVAYILQKIHAKGYLYLDIKPENVLILDSYNTRVQLFDLDSLYPFVSSRNVEMNDIRLSYSQGFAAIELRTGNMRKIGPHTDVFGVGALLYYLLFGTAPTARDCEPSAFFDYTKMLYSDVEHYNKLFFVLNDFFHNALANFYLDRYANMQQVVDALDIIEHIADNTIPYIQSTEIITPKNFVGRKQELSALEQWFEKDESKCIFVTGIGGIGKSTLVRAFLSKRRSKIDSVLYLYYTNSLEQTLTDDYSAKINTISKSEHESISDYYKRKLDAFQNAVKDTHSVLVIDNFYGKENFDISKILNVGWKVIFISREETLLKDFPTLSVKAIDNKTDLRLLFENSLGRHIPTNEQNYVDNIISQVSGHTLVLELIANQIASSYLDVRQAANLVSQLGFSEIAPEKVTYDKDNTAFHETIHNIITELFNAEKLSECKKSILKVLSLFDESGIDIHLFHEILEIKTKEDVNILIRDGWIENSGNSISLHPVIRETVHCWDWSENSEKYALLLMNFLIEELKKSDESNNRAIFNRKKVDLYLKLSESVLESCKRTHLLRRNDIFTELLYFTVINMPRYREDFILKQSEILIRRCKIRNDSAMKVYGRMLAVYQERKDYNTSLKKLKEAENVARKSGNNYVYALYYELLSDFYDAVLDGAYDSEQSDAKYIFKKMTGAIDKTIRYSKKVRLDGRKLLAKNLLAKATILMRNNSKNKKAANRLLNKARELVLSDNQPFSRNKFVYYMVCAWYFTLVEPYFEKTIDCLENANEIYKKITTTQLDKIDDILIPSADIYRTWNQYSDSARLLSAAIEICNKNDTVVPYIRKKFDLYCCLLDVCFEWNKIDFCKTIITEIDDENARYKQLGIHKEISKEMRESIEKIQNN